MKLNISKDELEQMSYDDVAYLILKRKKKKMNLQDLFKGVIEIMELPASDFDTHIVDFFELLSTDKRFLMLEKGFWDLKENHKANIVIDEDEEIIEEEVEEEIQEEVEEEINYDDDTIDDDDAEDDLKDLVVMDEEDIETDNL